MSDVTRHTGSGLQIHVAHDATGYPCFYIHGLAGDEKRDGKSLDAYVRLFEAAPELLEALRLLLKEMELSGNAGSKDYGWPVAITKSREAIAKATLTDESVTPGT